MAEEKTHCPICGTEMLFTPRYPRAVCPECARRAKAEDGRRLIFGNVSMSGGYAAGYADTGEPYDSHDCYIDGVKCRADEARFGGIVIETIDG